LNGERNRKKAFSNLKVYLENMIKMTSPDPKDPLLLYTSASQTAVSAVLGLERTVEGQLPVYFVSEALSGSKLFYSIQRLKKSLMRW